MRKDNKFQSEDETKAEILHVHDSFWEALGNRDPETRFSFCVDKITFIGTGQQKRIFCY
jgi:hypothetical protein